jgi:hypothetical protein
MDTLVPAQRLEQSGAIGFIEIDLGKQPAAGLSMRFSAAPLPWLGMTELKGVRTVYGRIKVSESLIDLPSARYPSRHRFSQGLSRSQVLLQVGDGTRRNNKLGQITWVENDAITRRKPEEEGPHPFAARPISREIGRSAQGFRRCWRAPRHPQPHPPP